MNKRNLFATVAVISLAACSPEHETITNETIKPDATHIIQVSAETEPSTSDSASTAIWWPASDSSTDAYIIGAVEDGIEVYSTEGTRLSKTDGGEIESLGLVTRFGKNKQTTLLALDTSSSTLKPYTIKDGSLQQALSGSVKSSLLLEGMCSFTSPLDGQSYAFLLGSNGQIEQWHIYEDKTGTFKGTLARNLQMGTEPKFCVTDPKTNSVYITEEAVGVWHFDADVEAETIPKLIDVKKFGNFTGEVGGLAVYYTASHQGVLLASDVETSTINAYDIMNDHKFIGRAQFAAGTAVDQVDNAGSLFASSGGNAVLLLSDEDNGEDATNFKMVPMSAIATAFGFDTNLTAAPEHDVTANFALVQPSLETAPVATGGDAADDPAIWVHPTDPDKSLIIGTNKKGGLYTYNLDGSVHQYLPDGKMNNVDIRYNVHIGDKAMTLVTASDRTHESIAIYQMDEKSRQLVDVADGLQPTGMPDPYGLCMYQSAASGKAYVFINEKDGLIRQWELGAGSEGRVKATPVREFAVGSTAEGCVADDDTGALYAAEEDIALWKYGAEPDAGSERVKITDPKQNPALKDDLEGVSLYYGENGKGYIVLSSQGNNSYALFDRAEPHAYIGSYRVIADSENGIDGSSETDGLDIISTPLGSKFPYGVFVAQDGRNISPAENQNFKLVPWERIADAFQLEKYTGHNPRGE
ncbi:phytase [Kordiimonas pumila]|uniref:Phytase n=1 Tax=Kordiimonas pumila TaxID=2161677 RepID=A0ABV7D4S4_9PROT|nr:phytase [Kordiimonas pumila]